MHTMPWYMPVFKKMDRSDWMTFVVFWACALPFILPSYKAPWPNTLLAVGIMVFLYSLYTYLIVLGVMYTFLPRRQYVLIGVYLIGLMLLFSLLNRWFEFQLLHNFKHYLNWHAVIYSLIDMGTECGVLMAVFAGKQYMHTQQQLLRMQKENREAALLRLQAQVDPHFLFNNLNILDVLIEQNPAEARQYLKHLSALYRALLRHQDQELIPLEEEWAFAQDYIYLLKKRFGQAFVFHTDLRIENPQAWMLPPGALQTLLENAVKHNFGDDHAPVNVHIGIRPGQLRVSNTFRPKQQAAPGSGAGLANLRARFQLLGLPLPEVRRGDNFEVLLPLIKMERST
jgi:two-component system, LytTR family, sensor kinase